MWREQQYIVALPDGLEQSPKKQIAKISSDLGDL